MQKDKYEKGKYEQICISQSEKSTWHGCFDGFNFMYVKYA